MISDPELASWLRLTLTPGIGGTTLRGLLQRYGLPTQILRQGRSTLAQFVAESALQALESKQVSDAVDAARRWVAEPRRALVTLADPTFPALLLETGDPPALLYAAGRVELLHRPALAIIGSRNASPQGERNATSFAKVFSEGGLTIVSGFAAGIDAAAHRGALAGEGSTIAVLGTGIDVVYPPRNRDLAEQIAAEGLLISEFPLGTAPLAQNFPRRNRLISGLARGCLVVEAALGSGSLITAKLAAEQGREVFAVPGSIHSPLSKGCHALIKSGAKLVESAEDVLVELGALVKRSAPAPARDAAPDADDDALLAHMGYDPIDLDTLCVRSGLPVARLSSELLRLEMSGRISVLPGGRYQRLV